LNWLFLPHLAKLVVTGYVAGLRFIVIHPDFINRWAGRTDKIFVIMRETMIQDGRAGAVLKSFVSYDVNGWDQTHVERMVIYSQ